jgi:hypothetical protein
MSPSLREEIGDTAYPMPVNAIQRAVTAPVRHLADVRFIASVSGIAYLAGIVATFAAALVQTALMMKGAPFHVSAPSFWGYVEWLAILAPPIWLMLRPNWIAPLVTLVVGLAMIAFCVYVVWANLRFGRLSKVAMLWLAIGGVWAVVLVLSARAFTAGLAIRRLKALPAIFE